MTIAAAEQAPGRWTTAGLTGGYVESLAVHPAVPGRVLAGTRQGVFLSADGGDTWRSASAGLTQLNVRDVTFDRERPDVAYAGTTRGLFKSMTGGTTWVPLGLPMADALEVELLYRATPRVLVNTTWQLRASDDGGLTWRTLYDRRQQLFDIAVSPAHPDVVYIVVRDFATNTTMLKRSDDGGETWADIASTEVWSLDVDPSDPSTLVAVAPNGLSRSQDGGKTWEPVDLPEGLTGRVSDVARAPSTPEILYATGDYPAVGRFVLRSDDGGATWTHAADLAENAYPAPLAVGHSADAVYVGTFGNGIARSTDGGETFAYANVGLTALPARDIAVDPRHPARSFAVTWNRGVFRSDDAGSTWDDVMKGFGDPAHPLAPVSVAAVAVDAASDVYASRWLSGVPGSAAIFHSADGGETWERTGAVPGPGARLLEAHPSRSGWLLAGTTAGVYRTTDRGESWEPVGPLDGHIEDIAVASGGEAVYVATGDDASGNHDASRLYVSRDFGVTWERLTYPPIRHVISLGVRSEPAILYAGAGPSSEVAFSLDGGDTWVLRPVDPTNFASSVAAVAVDPLDPTQVLAGTQRGGVWLSRDAGLTWIPTTPGVSGQEVYDIAFVPLPEVPVDVPGVDAAPALVGVTLPRRAGVSKVVLSPNAFRNPRIAGDAAPGKTLSCERGRWSRAKRFAYSWARNGQIIEGADGPTYRARAADASKSLTCRVRARGPGGRGRAVTRAVVVR